MEKNLNRALNRNKNALRKISVKLERIINTETDLRNSEGNTMESIGSNNLTRFINIFSEYINSIDNFTAQLEMVMIDDDEYKISHMRLKEKAYDMKEIQKNIILLLANPYDEV